MIAYSMPGDGQPRDDDSRRRIAFDADLLVEHVIGGTRIPLPSVPFIPIEPMRAPRRAESWLATRPFEGGLLVGA
jgi:hypothetical protein